jgi:uncharacterized membrane protein YqjE
VALLLLGVGFVGLIALLLLLLLASDRLPALAVLVLLFVVGAVGLMLLARRRLQSPGGLFAASAAELARDRADLGAGG